MAEILNSGVNHYFKDVATSGGNTIIGAAAPTDVNAQGISKEAGETGVFIYTDKSFTVYMCYGSTWVEYMTVDSTDADFDNAVSIPWASHDTHGAATAMYFVTAEANHEIRAVKIFNHLITDFIPSDSDFQKNALIESDSTVSTSGSGVLAGSKIHYSPEAHNLAGKAAGETFSYVLNGLVGGALTFMDGYTQVKTTIEYNAETGKSTISFIIPAGYNGSQVFKTHTKGGSPLSDPFTRSVNIPGSPVNWLRPEVGLNYQGTAVLPGEKIATITNGGSNPDIDAYAEATAVTFSSDTVMRWDYNTSDYSAAYSHVPNFSGYGNVKYIPQETDFSNGVTLAFGLWGISNNASHSGFVLNLGAGNPDYDQLKVWIGNDDGSGKKKVEIYVNDNAGLSNRYLSDDYVLNPHAWHSFIITWDGTDASAPTLKVNGTSYSMSANGTTTLDAAPRIPSGGYYILGEFVNYESVLSGTDLEQLEAYFDFKYVNYADSEVMWNEANWKDIMAFSNNNPPGQTPTSITGYNNAQSYWMLRTEKMFKVGSRAEVKYTSDTYVYNGPSQIFITDDLEWQSKNKMYGYFYNDMKSTSAGYLLRLATNYLYVYHSDGAGNMPLVFNANAGNAVTDEISFIVEWDGTCKVAKNGTVLATLPTKFTVGNHYAPFLYNQRNGEGSISIDGNLVDWAWPSNYSSETAIDATPTYVSGNAQVSGNHINYGASTMAKGGRVKVATLQGEGAYVDWQPHPYHGSNRHYMTLSTTPDVFAYNDANAEIGIWVKYESHQHKVYKSGTVDHLMTRNGFGGYTSWGDYYNDISNSYEGDEHINRFSFGRLRIQFYDDHVIFWSNGYPLYRIDGIDTSLQYEFNIDMYDVTWSPGFEDIKIYNP